MKRILLVLLFLVLAANAYPANKWLNQDNTDAIVGTQNVSDLDATVTAYLQDPLNDMITHYIWGCTLTRTSATVVTVSAGEVTCANGAGTIISPRKNTSTTTVNMAVAGVGGIDSGSAEKASTWYSVYAVADADATTFTAICAEQGVALSDVTHYRYIGSFFNDAAQDILNFCWSGNGQEITYMWDVPINETSAISAGAWGDLDCSSSIPATSTLGIFDLYIEDTATSAGTSIRPKGTTWDDPTDNQGRSTSVWIDIGGAGSVDMSAQRICATDSSQVIQYYSEADDTFVYINTIGYILNR